jgi:hypothetical protein
MPCEASERTVSACVAGCRKLMSTAPFFMTEISLSRGA